MEVRVGVMLARLLRDRKSSVDRRQGAIHIGPHGFKLGEQTVKRWRAALVALSEIGVQRLSKPKRPRLWIAVFAMNPICEHLSEVGIGLQVVLVR